jgi:hypothetical protein
VDEVTGEVEEPEKSDTAIRWPWRSGARAVEGGKAGAEKLGAKAAPRAPKKAATARWGFVGSTVSNSAS